MEEIYEIYEKQFNIKINEYTRENKNKKQCLICKVVGTEDVYKHYYFQNGIKKFYDCCRICQKKINKEVLEKEIIEIYNYYLNNKLTNEIINDFYFKIMSDKYIIKSYKNITDILHEIYEYENDPSSFILK